MARVYASTAVRLIGSTTCHASTGHRIAERVFMSRTSVMRYVSTRHRILRHARIAIRCVGIGHRLHTRCQYWTPHSTRIAPYAISVPGTT
eukprot:1592394-Rhodomonas_salina.3